MRFVLSVIVASLAVFALALAGCAGKAAGTFSSDIDEGRHGFEVFEGAGLDGLVCKALETTYQPDKRVMLKVKHARTADVVVAGWRPHKQKGPEGQDVVGSLMLGLYDDEGSLQSVGVAASFTMARRAELVVELADQELPHRFPVPLELGETRTTQTGFQILGDVVVEVQLGGIAHLVAVPDPFLLGVHHEPIGAGIDGIVATTVGIQLG